MFLLMKKRAFFSLSTESSVPPLAPFTIFHFCFSRCFTLLQPCSFFGHCKERFKYFTGHSFTFHILQHPNCFISKHTKSWIMKVYFCEDFIAWMVSHFCFACFYLWTFNCQTLPCGLTISWHLCLQEWHCLCHLAIHIFSYNFWTKFNPHPQYIHKPTPLPEFFRIVVLRHMKSSKPANNNINLWLKNQLLFKNNW